MRQEFFAALVLLLAGHGLFGQQPDIAPALTDVSFDTTPDASRVWGSGEFLIWNLRNGRVPPLVTAGGNGVPGSLGTRVLVDSLDFADDFRPGGRFTLGYQFANAPSWGAEASAFFLPDQHADQPFASSGSPLLARPYINSATLAPAATLIASPGSAAGSVDVGTQTGLWGAEANLTNLLVQSGTIRVTALGGFRTLRLDDELTIDEQFRVAPAAPGFGGSTVRLLDEFRTSNTFYGGQVGLAAGMQLGRISLDVRGKLGIGQMHEVANVVGVMNVQSPSGQKTQFQGGLLALRSNIGRHERDELAFVPELGVNLGVPLTRRLRLTAGYSLLWLSTVARAGEQIDPVVNVSQFPLLSANGPLVGPARPAFDFVGTDFWAQGVNVGLEFKF